MPCSHASLDAIHVRMFGNLPAPGWVHDTVRFARFVQQPLAGHMPIPQRVERTREDELELIMGTDALLGVDSVDTCGVVAWHMDLDDHVRFGWGAYRVIVGRDEGGRPYIQAHKHKAGNWTILPAEEHYALMMGLGVSCSRSRTSRDTPAFEKMFSPGDVGKIALAWGPWETDRMARLGGSSLYLNEQGKIDGVTHLQHWGCAPPKEEFLRWLGYQLRRVGRRFPELRLLVLALARRSRSSVKSLVGCMNFAMASLRADPNWKDHPWLWMTLFGQGVEHYGSLTVQQARSLVPNQTQIDDLPFMAEADVADLSSWIVDKGGPLGRVVEDWIPRQSMSQLCRLAAACSIIGGLDRFSSPPWAVVYALAKTGVGIPSSCRLHGMLNTFGCLRMLLADIPDWVNSKEIWHVPNTWVIHQKLNTQGKGIIHALEASRCLVNEVPGAIGHVGRAMEVLLRAPGLAKHQDQMTIEQQFAMVDQLAFIEIARRAQWPLEAGHMTWEQLVGILRQAEGQAWRDAMALAAEGKHDQAETLLVNTQSSQGTFAPRQLHNILTQEPGWRTWRDARGMNILDWMVLRWNSPLDEQDVWWMVDQAPELLTNVRNDSTTLNDLPLEEALRARVRQALLIPHVVQRGRENDQISRM